jgi:hypothetical protein
MISIKDAIAKSTMREVDVHAARSPVAHTVNGNVRDAVFIGRMHALLAQARSALFFDIDGYGNVHQRHRP